METNNHETLTVDEAIARADGALKNGDLNLASALYDAIVAHDRHHPIASFGKHKIDFLKNELVAGGNPYGSLISEKDISTPGKASDAVAASDRGLTSPYIPPYIPFQA